MKISHGTLIGICAILLWSTLIGLMRIVSAGLGPLLGPASIYTVAFIITLICTGFPRLTSFPRSYLILGSFLTCTAEAQEISVQPLKQLLSQYGYSQSQKQDTNGNYTYYYIFLNMICIIYLITWIS